MTSNLFRATLPLHGRGPHTVSAYHNLPKSTRTLCTDEWPPHYTTLQNRKLPNEKCQLFVNSEGMHPRCEDPTWSQSLVHDDRANSNAITFRNTVIVNIGVWGKYDFSSSVWPNLFKCTASRLPEPCSEYEMHFDSAEAIKRGDNLRYWVFSQAIMEPILKSRAVAGDRISFPSICHEKSSRNSPTPRMAGSDVPNHMDNFGNSRFLCILMDSKCALFVFGNAKRDVQRCSQSTYTLICNVR